MRLLLLIILVQQCLISTVIAGINQKEITLIHALEKIQSNNIPGFSFAIVNENEIILSGASGVVDLKSQKKFTIDTMIRIGSITKSFNALAVLTLKQQQKLKLDDTIKLYIDDLPLSNEWSKTNPVTIAQLLEHTSGLMDLSRSEFAFNDGSVKSLKKAFSFKPKNRITMWPPGMFSSYSNAGAGYLGYAIEKITGKTYEKYLSEAVLKPLQMDNSNFFLDSDTEIQLATGYDSDGVSVIPYWHMIFRPFGALNTTTRQMTSFVKLFLNNGKVGKHQLISKENIVRMEVPRTTLAAKSGLEFGYGLANYTDIRNGLVFHGHGGDGDGYLAHFAYNRDSGLGYFIVINAYNKPGIYNMSKLIEDYITVDVVQKKQVNVFKHSMRRQFVGTYESVTKRMPWFSNNKKVLKITFENSQLMYNFDGMSQPLIAVNKYHFRFKDQPVATMAFIVKNKKMYFINDDGNFLRK